MSCRPGNGAPGIEDLDLEVSAGESVALLGPPGSGQRVLLRLLATAVRPTAGRLHILGHDARRPRSALRRRIGYAGDPAGLLDELTGRESAEFFARAYGLNTSIARAAVAELLERLGLRSAADRAVAIYSVGMRRKLLLLGALAHRPDLVLLDDPTADLDAEAREAVFALLAERRAAGAAVVFATSDAELAARESGRVLLLHRGRLAAAGRPDHLVRTAGLGTRIEILLEPGPQPRLIDVVGVVVDTATPERLVLRTELAAGAVLPEICRALAAAGAAIRRLDVREPDLRAAFSAATGAGWRDDEC